MNLSAYSQQELKYHLTSDGVSFVTGPFTIRLQSGLQAIHDHLRGFYANYEVLEHHEFADFHIRMDYPANFRRWLKPQVYFYLDGRVPFKPLPANQASPMLEWGMNWCIANHAHQYLIIHAAALEKDGYGVFFPAAPGSGKSTLTAALMSHGWRLFSDELGIIDLQDGTLVPLSRPVNLKNESIDIIRRFSPGSIISKHYEDTNKGTVALVAAPNASIRSATQKVRPRFIIQPQYQAGVEASLMAMSKAQMFMHVAKNSFNYSVLGKRAFSVLSDVVDASDCYNFTYSRLDDAIITFDRLLESL